MLIKKLVFFVLVIAAVAGCAQTAAADEAKAEAVTGVTTGVVAGVVAGDWQYSVVIENIKECRAYPNSDMLVILDDQDRVNIYDYNGNDVAGGYYYNWVVPIYAYGGDYGYLLAIRAEGVEKRNDIYAPGGKKIEVPANAECGFGKDFYTVETGSSLSAYSVVNGRSFTISKTALNKTGIWFKDGLMRCADAAIGVVAVYEGFYVIKQQNVTSVFDYDNNLIKKIRGWYDHSHTLSSRGYYVTETVQNGSDRLYGLSDLSGKEILPCEYSYINMPKDGYYYIGKYDSSLGYELQILNASAGDIGVENVKNIGRVHVYGDFRDETTGKEYLLIREQPKWLGLESGYEDLPPLYGLADWEGNIILPMEYDAIHSLSDGMIAVCKDMKWGFANLDGEVVIPPQYADFTPFNDGIAGVITKDGYSFYINKKNVPVLELPIGYTAAGAFYDGLSMIMDSEYKKGFVDKSGNITIIPNSNGAGIPWRHATNFDGSNAVVWTNKENLKDGSMGKAAVIQYNAEKPDFAETTSANWEYVVRMSKYPFCQILPESGLICVKSKDGKYGLLDRDGKEITGLIYDGISEVGYSGYIVAKTNGKDDLSAKYTVLDSTGKKVKEYSNAYFKIVQNSYSVETKKDLEINVDGKKYVFGKSGFVKDGVWLNPATSGYFKDSSIDITYAYSDFFALTQGKTTFVYDYNGKILCKIKDDCISIYPDRTYLYYVYEKLMYGVKDFDGNEVLPPNFHTLGRLMDSVTREYTGLYAYTRYYENGVINPKNFTVFKGIESAWIVEVDAENKLIIFQQIEDGSQIYTLHTLYNFDGKKLNTVKSRIIQRASDGLLVYCGENFKYGYMDTSGKVVIDAQYDLANPFSEGLAGVINDDGKSGYINKNGEFVFMIEGMYEAGQFSEGLAMIRRSEYWRGIEYIDKTGKIVVSQIPGGKMWYYATPFNNGIASVAEHLSYANQSYGPIMYDSDGIIKIKIDAK